MNKICFEKSINKIKHQGVKEYFLKLMSVRNLFIKGMLIVLLVPIILGLCFTMRSYFIDYHLDKVVLNPGVAFSGAANLNWVSTLMIQLIPTLIAFIAALFLNTWYVYIFLFFLAFGGTCNVIDRFIVDPDKNVPGIHTVVDYIDAGSSIFNLPDIFVVSGSVGFSVMLLVRIIIMFRNDKKENETNH